MTLAAICFNTIVYGVMCAVSVVVLVLPTGTLERYADRPVAQLRRSMWLIGTLGAVGVLLEIGR